MAGQGKVSNLKNKYAVLSANSNTNKNWTYHITTASTITLPDTATLVAGDWVAFTKQYSVSPIIQRFGSTVLIQSGVASGATFLFQSSNKIVLVFNGTDWEVINLGKAAVAVLTGGGNISAGTPDIVITDSSFYTLPDTTPLANGFELQISWFHSAVPTLNRQGASTLLRRVGITDTNLVCDVETKISLYLNKSANIWEIR